MRLVLVHEHFDAAHLAAVTAEMLRRGAPTLRAYSIDGGEARLLEGCHRARAAADLGLAVEVELVSLTDEDMSRTLAELLGDPEAGDITLDSLTSSRQYAIKATWVRV